MSSIWTEFLKLAKQEVGTQVVETWLKCVTVHRICNSSNEVILQAPNQFVANWIVRNYLELIKRGLGRVLGVENVAVVLQHSSVALATENNFPAESISETACSVAPAAKISSKKTGVSGDLVRYATSMPAELSQGAKRDLASKKMGIDSKYRFNTLIVGPHNHLAYSAAVAICKGASKNYNPLFIYGPTGLGKTHLLNCIGNETRELRPNAKIVYRTSDKFVDDFIRSIRFDKIDHFKEKYCTTDLLLIDDIQFLSQKEQTQEIFFHIFNNMHQNNKQIVLSSDMPPNMIQGLQERLKSRFGWGLIADIQRPELETRIAILMKKAEDMQLNLSYNIAAKIAQKITSNIRELEGTLTRLSTISVLEGQQITEQSVDQILNLLHHQPVKNQLCPDILLRNVAKIFSVSLNDIKSTKREKNVALARQVAMYLLRTKTTFALKTIGSLVGGKNHATVLHAIGNVEEKIKHNAELAGKIQSVLSNMSSVNTTPTL